MAKLILSLENAPIGEYTLNKERMTIGRRTTNDIHIDNLAVSGEHAAIVQMGRDYFIEDLGSTNGTVVNAKSIKKHLLQHADLIALGKYQLKYINEALLNTLGTGGDVDFDKAMIIRSAATQSPATIPAPVSISSSSVASAAATQGLNVTVPVEAQPPITPAATVAPIATSASDELLGKIQVLNGSSSGRELLLNKALTTLGKPGVQVAVITKRPKGYFITHVEGKTYPVINGTSTGSQAHVLSDNDVIELAGVKMKFYLT